MRINKEGSSVNARSVHKPVGARLRSFFSRESGVCKPTWASLRRPSSFITPADRNFASRLSLRNVCRLASSPSWSATRYLHLWWFVGVVQCMGGESGWFVMDGRSGCSAGAESSGGGYGESVVARRTFLAHMRAEPNAQR